jgi:A/G-specific adenine glycosylase
MAAKKAARGAERRTATGHQRAAAEPSTAPLDPAEFRKRLMHWYGAAARKLPWRGTTDPYQIWVSEIMLQQTRVAAVIEHYNEFLRRFPTLVALALAEEADILAAWSGLGYYRRARMLHKAARFIVLERDGRLPATAAELRTLPGIGDYTAAAIGSIAFGEPVAVVDGNVERVILRLTGNAEDATATARAEVRDQAQMLMPDAEMLSRHPSASAAVAPAGLRAVRRKPWATEERIALAASAHPTERAGGDSEVLKTESTAAGDHNQAMMELGATVCLPRAPLCDACPVYAMCRTRGEHATPPRAPQRSRPAAYLLDLRKHGTATEVLLELRAGDASMMPAMFELPPLPADAVESREPVLRLRHSITNTNYYVQVYAPQRFDPGAKTKRAQTLMHPLRKAVQDPNRELHWVRTARLPGIPMTGLTRKILQRLRVMDSARMALLE